MRKLKGLYKKFGILKDYKDRVNKKLSGTHDIPSEHKFFTTPSRPSNFGEHLDLKVNIDNWFDENRVHNEADPEIRRTQIYLWQAAY